MDLAALKYRHPSGYKCLKIEQAEDTLGAEMKQVEVVGDKQGQELV